MITYSVMLSKLEGDIWLDPVSSLEGVKKYPETLLDQCLLPEGTREHNLNYNQWQSGPHVPESI